MNEMFPFPELGRDFDHRPGFGQLMRETRHFQVRVPVEGELLHRPDESRRLSALHGRFVFHAGKPADVQNFVLENVVLSQICLGWKITIITVIEIVWETCSVHKTGQGGGLRS